MNFIEKVLNLLEHKFSKFINSLNRDKKRELFFQNEIHKSLDYDFKVERKKVLIIGIFLTDYENQAEHLISQFSKSQKHDVDQKWIAIGKNDTSLSISKYLLRHERNKIPKFRLLNEVLSTIDINKYDYIIISDDDVAVHDQFIDAYIEVIEQYNLKIAQPSRAKHSYNVHNIVLQNKKYKARETNFVEIGPIFSFHKSIYKYVLPFPSEAEMGWGLDYIWPKLAEKNNFKIGIVDLVSADHSYRPQSKTYSNDVNGKLMHNLLSKYDNSFLEKSINKNKIK